MRVLIVSCVFAPEPVVSARTSNAIAAELVKGGHEVTVITTFPNRPGGKLFAGFSRKSFTSHRSIHGFEIIRCFSIFSRTSSIVSRLFENISFGLSGGWAVLKEAQPDVIYANTWPIFATGILALIATLRRVPMVLSIQDVYPESLYAQRRIQRGSLLGFLMAWLDGITARSAASVIVISKHFAEVYSEFRRVNQNKLFFVPNWSTDKQLESDSSTREFRRVKGIPEREFLIAYGGNIGVAAGVETVVAAFRFFHETEAPYLLIAGEGSSALNCMRLAKSVSNKILFHTPWKTEETSILLQSADLLVLPTSHEQSLASVPSKLISYMLAGRPLIALATPQSDLAEIIDQAICGWVIEPDQPHALAAKIKEVMSLSREALHRHGQQGRDFALAHFTDKACIPKVLDIINQAASVRNIMGGD